MYKDDNYSIVNRLRLIQDEPIDSDRLESFCNKINVTRTILNDCGTQGDLIGLVNVQQQKAV